ncbi:hypothetical protein CERSUDRAFT_127544 [Gelatoporia subvermispora B]|uniref:Uncharacterized protein n=1 Tax=Ceriporiopsis subvermispora (strain B) TaxID=914234 RepID=M2Q2Y9_CERS8|nr:hypothetical protein CERSUDRAFT_127544 [Gelatoporia subvermispora B]
MSQRQKSQPVAGGHNKTADRDRRRRHHNDRAVESDINMTDIGDALDGLERENIVSLHTQRRLVPQGLQLRLAELITTERPDVRSRHNLWVLVNNGSPERQLLIDSLDTTPMSTTTRRVRRREMLIIDTEMTEAEIASLRTSLLGEDFPTLSPSLSPVSTLSPSLSSVSTLSSTLSSVTTVTSGSTRSSRRSAGHHEAPPTGSSRSSRTRADGSHAISRTTSAPVQPTARSAPHSGMSNRTTSTSAGSTTSQLTPAPSRQARADAPVSPSSSVSNTTTVSSPSALHRHADRGPGSHSTDLRTSTSTSPQSERSSSSAAAMSVSTPPALATSRTSSSHLSRHSLGTASTSTAATAIPAMPLPSTGRSEPTTYSVTSHNSYMSNIYVDPAQDIIDAGYEVSPDDPEALSWYTVTRGYDAGVFDDCIRGVVHSCIVGCPNACWKKHETCDKACEAFRKAWRRNGVKRIREPRLPEPQQ